jgi:hypothetical protein
MRVDGRKRDDKLAVVLAKLLVLLGKRLLGAAGVHELHVHREHDEPSALG